jgi:ABC-type polysaccharide/polyol phosphate export permease
MVIMFQIFAVPRYRDLLAQLINRELVQRYKQSVLGYFWVILNPLAQMLVMSFVFSQIFNTQNLGVPYPLFLFAALLPWTLFSQSLTSSVTALVSNSNLLSKIYFPREVLVLSVIFARIVDFLFATAILIFMMIFYHQTITWQILWVIPIFLIQLLFTYGLGLFFAAANLFYRDVQYLLNLIVLVWMYLTPIMYNANIFPEKYQWVFQINPLSVIVNAYREVILNGHHPNFFSLTIALFLAVIICALGFQIFKKLEGQFADSV